ncbi:N-acetylmuramoyl-L-alanine amidase [Paludicola sp. MB14-C6]|uniref:N-acetylmuramoyl-L-alanine amidase n=1 Tax=Paludihabitans sp. MB14-C6 TaxID=3070656 RepID=UPI0027DABA6F|nr:N-acetylmuramoyl-L-alanine amidase [Paludicola sp. MB14-C6]WMJ22960.1 N-acetylmuramoyl-L-alanine amidase [Paludicola sp. MB14-C6]
MFTKSRQYNTVFGTILVIVIIAVVVLTVSNIATTISVNKFNFNECKQVVIDPGHGGFDPGAIGVNKALEKDINLAIGLQLRDILIANGYDVIMTRTNDTAINENKISGVKSSKTSDLKNRLKIIENHPKAIALSIHQNEYVAESSSGAQMFYGRKNEASKSLAESIQNSFVNNLQPNNKRVVKRSTSDVYIVHNSKTPIVLVECGFLSNWNDAKLLTNEEYQKKVAFTIYCGIAKAKYMED